MPPDGGRSMQQMPLVPGMGAGQPMAPGPGGMTQGQQPILNVSSS